MNPFATNQRRLYSEKTGQIKERGNVRLVQNMVFFVLEAVPKLQFLEQLPLKT
jgi:hypothetical protein